MDDFCVGSSIAEALTRHQRQVSKRMCCKNVTGGVEGLLRFGALEILGPLGYLARN